MRTLSIDDGHVFTGAEFSDCRTWRYSLWREWGHGEAGNVAFIGLNPSTADESDDDPTIRRCIGFAKQWGYDGIFMLNLFAFRATDPKVMMAAKDPVGPENDAMLAKYVAACPLTVAAWGVYGSFLSRAFDVKHNILKGLSVKCLGKTSGGMPKHPLYLPKSAALIDY